MLVSRIARQLVVEDPFQLESEGRMPEPDARSKSGGDRADHPELDGDFSKLMETIGIEDTRVDVAKTATMRPPTRRVDSGPQEQVGHLPRLMGPTEAATTRDTMPELRVKGQLGEGGMGLVQLAEQVPLGRDVAIKKVREESMSDEARIVLLREGWTTGLLEHPNVVPVYTLGRDEHGEPVIVMKRVEGVPWMDIIDDPELAPSAFEHSDPTELHVEVLVQVCNAIHFAHSRGIIHRDLKPENIMLGEFGEVYVLDWGIAVSLEEDPRGRLISIKDVTTPAGTPAYMAPEMVSGDGTKLSVKTDVYLLGATLFEALTGRPPHSGETLHQIMFAAFRSEMPSMPDSVPAELVAVCRRAMAKESEERFESVEALRLALLEYREKRESRRLSRTGDKRQEELYELLERERGGADLEEAKLYKVFGECRFAYEQALEIASDNPRAIDGLQAALEMMAERELRHEAHKAASLLVADLPRPNDDLQARLERLSEQLQSREEEFENLQKIKHDKDTEVGRASRSIFAMVTGVVWAALTFGIQLAIGADLVEFTHPFVMSHVVGLILLAGGMLWVGHKKLFQNEVNKRMLLSIVAMFIAAVFMRGAVWAAGTPPEIGLALEMIMYGAAGSALAVGVDLRILWASVPFAVAGVIAAAMPDQVFVVFGITNIAAMGSLAVAWWPRGPEC